MSLKILVLRDLTPCRLENSHQSTRSHNPGKLNNILLRFLDSFLRWQVVVLSLPKLGRPEHRIYNLRVGLPNYTPGTEYQFIRPLWQTRTAVGLSVPRSQQEKVLIFKELQILFAFRKADMIGQPVFSSRPVSRRLQTSGRIGSARSLVAITTTPVIHG
jgi:hypothetical protein